MTSSRSRSQMCTVALCCTVCYSCTPWCPPPCLSLTSVIAVVIVWLTSAFSCCVHSFGDSFRWLQSKDVQYSLWSSRGNLPLPQHQQPTAAGTNLGCSLNKVIGHLSRIASIADFILFTVNVTNSSCLFVVLQLHRLQPSPSLGLC